MKLIIAGSRDFDDYYLMEEYIRNMINIESITEVVSGTAKGADSLGEYWAQNHTKKVEKMPAWWEIYGKKAGYVRNVKMGEYADIAVVFWDGKSRGTKSMIDIMDKLGKQCYICMYKEYDRKPKIMTSYYKNVKDMHCDNLVGISRVTPEDFNGRMFKALAPSSELLNAKLQGWIGDEAFKDKYIAEIENTIGGKYKKLATILDGKILLCYEEPNRFCHRHILAEWLALKCDADVSEL